MPNNAQVIACTCFSDDVPLFAAEYTITDGISPGQGFIKAAPQGDLVSIFGTLTLGIGSDFVTIPIVIIDAQFDANTGGQDVTFQFVDPRYWWQNGELNGIYNIVLPDETLQTDTEKTPQELLTLCLQKMPKVAGFDVSAAPNTLRPSVEWIGANPAEELAKLCQILNCRVAWWIDGTVKIVVDGQGSLLDPTLPSEARSISFAIKPKPDKIVLYADVDLYQVMVPLEDVGMDRNGKLMRWNDLPQKPAGGWGSESPDHLGGVSEDKTLLPGGESVSLRELSLGWVFRGYRPIADLTEVFELPGGIFNPPSGNLTVSREDILPLLTSGLVETFIDTDGSKQQKSAFITGEFYHNGRPDTTNTTIGTKLELPFSFDPRTGVIITSRPVFKINSTDHTAEPARLWLHVAIRVKDHQTREPLRFKKERVLNSPSLGVGAHIIRAADVKRTFTVNYEYETVAGVKNNKITTVDVNTTEIEKIAKYYLDASEASFDRPDSAHDQIPWIVTDYRIDGAIRQLTFSADVYNGATTIVSRGTQHDLYVPGYKERRRKEQLAPAELSRREAELKQMMEMMKLGGAPHARLP